MSREVKRKQQNSKMCLVCGLKNHFGLRAAFYELEGDELVAVFRPMEEHQGYPNRLHGGIASAMLDETIGRAIMIEYDDNFWGVTVDLNIRFKKAIPLDQELRVVGRITKDGNRFFEGTGEIVLEDGAVAATASGRYMKLALEKIGGFDPIENEWGVVQDERDPKQLGLAGEARAETGEQDG